MAEIPKKQKNSCVGNGFRPCGGSYGKLLANFENQFEVK